MPKKLEKMELQREVMRLRVRGMEMDDICLALDLPMASIRAALKAAVEDCARDTREEAEEYKRIFEARKEFAVRSLLPLIEQGNTSAVGAWIKAEETYQKLFGYVGKDIHVAIDESNIKYYKNVSPDEWPEPNAPRETRDDG